MAFGNDAAIGATPNRDRIFELSQVLTDFSTSISWVPLRLPPSTRRITSR